MAKNLKDLINLAPTKAEPITGSTYIFHDQLMFVTGAAYVCGYHGQPSNGGGTRADWTVPAGVTTATFHLWGAGGSGAPGICCTAGLNGASGAYAYKKISVTPGDRYVLCTGTVCSRNCVGSGGNFSWNACDTTPLPGWPTDDCAPSDNPGWDPTPTACKIIGGCRGSKVFVLGNNLTNLCAEGGAPGISYHQMITSGSCVRDTAGPNGGYGACMCCNSYICACDILDRDPDDSSGSRYRSACYYGADGGARGLFAKFKHSCCGRYNQSQCYMAGNIQFVSFPAGQWWLGNTVSTARGFWAGSNSHHCTDNDWGSFGPHGTARRQNMMGNVIANNNFDNGHAMMGVGGLTAWTCAGTCCCGGSGGGGGIYINYE
tara:strand:- start:1895 stop:3016 length:1122 start_codon:yes stop_codon:yes gene_type:complete